MNPFSLKATFAALGDFLAARRARREKLRALGREYSVDPHVLARALGAGEDTFDDLEALAERTVKLPSRLFFGVYRNDSFPFVFTVPNATDKKTVESPRSFDVYIEGQFGFGGAIPDATEDQSAGRRIYVLGRRLELISLRDLHRILTRTYVGNPDALFGVLRPAAPASTPSPDAQP